jgi:putative spermidine/putrescine transport system substrate-binding protein
MKTLSVAQSFGSVISLLSLSVACAMPAVADEITFVSQGGAYQEAQTKAILDPAAKLLNITIKQDSAPDAWPMVKAQGEAKKPVWDVIDTPPSNCLRGGKEGLIEPLDLSKLPNVQSMPAAYRTPYSVAYEFYSSVIGYNKKNLKKVPQTWAEFWDVKNFPGVRAPWKRRCCPTACLATSFTRWMSTVPTSVSSRLSRTSPCGGPRVVSRRNCSPMAKSTC